MKIFAVDTSSAVATAAIVDGEKLICECVLNNKLTHSQTLMPMIDDVFKKSELIPAIIQDHESGEVLMLGYMNEESLRLTLETNKTWFYSRSRQKLWNKGETSGHFQTVKDIYYDCDEDTLLIKAEQIGAACHTGNRSCFYRKITEE